MSERVTIYSQDDEDVYGKGWYWEDLDTGHTSDDLFATEAEAIEDAKA